MEGVRAVVTHKDVPGLNRFGIVIPDQPVLCEDRVRYVGDAVAAVAAKTEDIAEAALELIHVVYRKLMVIDSPEKALEPDAHMLHPDGNILHRAFFSHGDVEAGFQSCHTILEETYELPRQMHTYMETEGVAVPERDGVLQCTLALSTATRTVFSLPAFLVFLKRRFGLCRVRWAAHLAERMS